MIKRIAEQLDNAIKDLNIPIDGISIGLDEDKATWTIHFKDTATSDQISQATDILNNFVYDEALNSKNQRYAKYANDLSIKGGLVLYKAQFPNATVDDFLDYLAALPN